MNIYELIELRNSAKSKLMEADCAFSTEQLCELYAAAVMAVHFSGNESLFRAAMERLEEAGGQPEVVSAYGNNNPVR